MKKRFLLCFLFLTALFFLSPSQSYAKVRLSKTKKTLVVKETYSLKVKGSRKKAVWRSSNPTVVSVSKKGKLKAKKKGNAIITASVGHKKLSCRINVVTPSMNSSMQLYLGDKRKISINNSKSFHKITYTSTNKNIASVSKTGRIKGIKKGSCYIRVTFNKAYTRKIRVSVIKASSSSTLRVMKGCSVALNINTYKNIWSGHYKVSKPANGYVSNGIYYSTNYGHNTVTYTNGVFKHTFKIKNYCWEAHRGYHAVEPENTLEAIIAAKNAGANSVEVDIRATKDGDFVLMHDSTLDRTTKLTGAVKNMTVEQLSYPIVINSHGPYRKVPTLKEALILCRSLNLNISIEVKTFPTINYTYSKEYLMKRLISLIKQYGNSYTCLLFTSADTAMDFIQYTDGTVTGRVTNDSYEKELELQTLVKTYPYMLTSTQYSQIYYSGMLYTQDNPIR